MPEREMQPALSTLGLFSHRKASLNASGLGNLSGLASWVKASAGLLPDRAECARWLYPSDSQARKRALSASSVCGFSSCASPRNSSTVRLNLSILPLLSGLKIFVLRCRMPSLAQASLSQRETKIFPL